jgi:hypothetical protein
MQLAQLALALALELCIESAYINPDWEFTWWVMAATAGMMGRSATVREAIENLQRLNNGVEIGFPQFKIFEDSRRCDCMQEGLRLAGLSDISRTE